MRCTLYHLAQIDSVSNVGAELAFKFEGERRDRVLTCASDEEAQQWCASVQASGLKKGSARGASKQMKAAIPAPTKIAASLSLGGGKAATAANVAATRRRLEQLEKVEKRVSREVFGKIRFSDFT